MPEFTEQRNHDLNWCMDRISELVLLADEEVVHNNEIITNRDEVIYDT